jgi:hypothetical protein
MLQLPSLLYEPEKPIIPQTYLEIS